MNTRRAFVLLLASLALPVAAQQSNDAVTWTSTAVRTQAGDGSAVYRLEFTGRIAAGYIVYGSDFEANLGPNPTRVRFEPAEAVTPRDSLRSTGTKKGKDKAFNTDYTYFEGEARLSQLVAVPAGARRITGTLRGQTCHEADGTCTLFRSSFDIPLPGL
jgi:hypothetical protein